MNVSFTFDINDLYDVTVRSSRRRIVRSWDRYVSAIALALLLVPVAGWSWYAVWKTGVSVQAFAFTLCGFAGWLMLWYRGQTARARVFDHLEYIAGGRGPFRCDVELLAGGVLTRQFDEETFRPWTVVSAVRDTPTGVEVEFGPRGLMVVRPNAFAAPADREAFVRAVEDGIRGAAVTQD